MHSRNDKHQGEHMVWLIVDYRCVSDCMRAWVEAHVHAPAFTGMQCEVKWGVMFRIGAFFGLAFIVLGCFGDWMWGWEAECRIVNS